MLLPDGDATGGQLDPVLGRIRALLAKAESTTFADDVAAVELLFTSLLLRAQTALEEAAGDNARLDSGQLDDRIAPGV